MNMLVVEGTSFSEGEEASVYLKVVQLLLLLLLLIDSDFTVKLFTLLMRGCCSLGLRYLITFLSRSVIVRCIMFST